MHLEWIQKPGFDGPWISEGSTSPALGDWDRLSGACEGAIDQLQVDLLGIFPVLGSEHSKSSLCPL